MYNGSILSKFQQARLWVKSLIIFGIFVVLVGVTCLIYVSVSSDPAPKPRPIPPTDASNKREGFFSSDGEESTSKDTKDKKADSKTNMEYGDPVYLDPSSNRLASKPEQEQGKKRKTNQKKRHGNGKHKHRSNERFKSHHRRHRHHH